MNMHLNTGAPLLAERGVEVPEALQTVVSHALEKEPAKRPQTVEDFAAELHTALQSLGEDDSPARAVGMQTVQITHVDTTDLRDGKGSETGLMAEGADGFKTVAGVSDVPSVPDAGVPWGVGGATVAETPADNGDARGSETGKQSPADTFGQFNVATPTERFSKEALTEPLTGMLDSVGLREEERKRRDAELLRQREEEEGRLREAQERERREAEERRRRELEERQSRPTVEHAVPAALVAQTQAASQAQPQSASQSPQPGVGAQPQYQHAGAGQGSYTPAVTGKKQSRAPFIVLGVAALVLLIGFGALAYFVVLPRLFAENTNGGDTNVNVNSNTNTSNANADTNANVNANTNANTNANANGTNEPVRADLVALPAGKFKMGRPDVPPITDALKTQRPAYLLWMYNQWPAHDTPVGAFAIPNPTGIRTRNMRSSSKRRTTRPLLTGKGRLRPRAASACPSRTSPSTTRTRSPRGARFGTASSTDSRPKRSGSTPRSAAARRRFRARPRSCTLGACSGLMAARTSRARAPRRSARSHWAARRRVWTT